MITIQGELYDFLIEHDKISISSKIPSLMPIQIFSNPEEDFSIFDLGPAIVGDIKMQAASCTIGNAIYENICLCVQQVPGKYVQFIIKHQRENQDDPIDSGATIQTLRDYIVKYNN